MYYWNLDEQCVCGIDQVNTKVQELVNKYKTDTVFVRQPISSPEVVVEAWFNFRVNKYMIVAYEKNELFEFDSDLLDLQAQINNN